MPLTPGTRLGPYEIQEPLGAGGMGEVYRARDTRLERSVAIKVLPEHLSSDPEVRARFEREARAVSQLNHPHICTLHDIGQQNGLGYLVLEHLEGETLAQRLERGPLPGTDLLRIGSEIADALDRAHRAGIIHRDLKPGNVMLTKSGAKLLDFGLARATGLSAVSELTSSPTIARALTSEGTILGTFQYMAPEQLEGKEADERSDVWALGAVLYEMATGKRAFEGRSQASLIASILQLEPAPIAQVAPLAPPALDRLVRACLAKDPEQRLQTAHDAKLHLQWIAEGGSQAGVPVPVAARRRRRESLAWILAGLGLAATVVLAAVLALRRPTPPRVLRFEANAPETVTNAGWPRLSPDGTMLAFLASDSSGAGSIWLRRLSELDARSLPGTGGAGRPCWSPDSRFLAYIQDGKLRKVPVDGGPVVTLGDTPGGADGSWGARGIVLFDGSSTDSIRGIPAGGGSVQAYTRIDRSQHETGHSWPYFLPDGRSFLFVTISSITTDGTIKLGRLGSWETRSLGKTDGRVEYDPAGYLVFTRDGSLMAQRFDARALRVRGEAVPIGENLAMGAVSGHFSLSGDGVLAFRTTGGREQSRLVWLDRTGREVGEAGPPASYHDVAIAPTGDRVAFTMPDPQQGHDDLWVRQLARGVSSRVTFDAAEDLQPVWSPDGQRIVWTSNRSGGYQMYTRLASGLGSEDSIAMPVGTSGPTDWSMDGRTIVARSFGQGNWDLWLRPLDPAEKPRLLLGSPFNENWGRLSPDGNWIAYSSNESGRSETYVQSIHGSGKWQVSTNGGGPAFWRADGRELYYRTAGGVVMAVPVQAAGAFESGIPVALFRATTTETGLPGPRWAPNAEGTRFLFNMPLATQSTTRFTVVTNWRSELARK